MKKEDNTRFEINNLAKLLFKRFNENWQKLSPEDFLAYLKSKIDQSIGFDDLEKKINQKKKLKIKMGIDPTGPDVHLGHLLPILVLRQFQKAGHKIDLIIGDFTAQIGDPSGRSSERKLLSDAQIKNNMASYKKQISSFLDLKKTTTHFNSTWLNKITLKKIISVFQKINVSEVLQREDFRKRLDSGHGLSMSEILYSYAQAEDSVFLKSDVEVGGKDQLLNFAQARNVMSIYGLVPETAITTPVLEGIFGDGKKMSKSLGNYIPILSSAEEKFGKIMSVPDNLIAPYFKAFADLKADEIEQIKSFVEMNPMETKKQLGMFLVAISEKKFENGEIEREKFEKKFSKKEFGKETPSLKIEGDENVFDALFKTGEFKSRGELFRIFEQSGVRLIEPKEKVLNKNDIVKNGIVKVGKIKYYKIVI